MYMWICVYVSWICVYVWNGLALNGISYYGKLRTARNGGSWL